MAMSISPPHWAGSSGRWGTTAPPGSYVGSLGMLGSSMGRDFGTSFGRERDRELEATYVRDFSCCGKRLRSLHELLEQ
jgi:transcription factor SFP1